MKKKTIKIILPVMALWLLAVSHPLLGQQAIIVNHNCTNIHRIPSYWLAQIRANLRIGYGHTSHGSQPVTGMFAFRGEAGSAYYFSYSGYGLEPGKVLNDYWGNAGGAEDLGGYGDLGWRDATVTMLEDPQNDRNVVAWSWCGGVSDNTWGGIHTYLTAMNQLELDYPGVKFVYMTGHLDGTGESENLHLRNQQIRSYCKNNKKTLFDFADIESFDPDGGTNYMKLLADDNCDYDSDGDGYEDSNWAVDWIAAHPGHELTKLAKPAICDDCAHSQRLNCVLKGRAFWWMLARLAGWNGSGWLTVTAPASGASWTRGSTHAITWTKGGVQAANVKIRLYRNGTFVKMIASSTANDGSFSWNVQSDLAAGSGYVVRITASDNQVEGDSKSFAIQ